MNQQFQIIKISLDQLDYEGELGIVIGKSGEKFESISITDYIYGYTIINDITDRNAK